MPFKPSTNDHLKNAVRLYYYEETIALNRYGEISEWDVSLITDMSALFSSKKKFNQNISKWDVSNVTNMSGMFERCHNFNKSLDNWDVSNVTNMMFMFFECRNFNQPLNNWNVSNVSHMANMFTGCKNFNQPLNKWNITNVTKCKDMFYKCDNYDYPVVMHHSIPQFKGLIKTKSILNNLLKNPYTHKEKNTIINSIMNTSLINCIYTAKSKLLIVQQYKNMFKGYNMPYKIVNYDMLCILEYFGIKMKETIDYDRFNNKLLFNLVLDKKNTIVTDLIKHIKKTDKNRYDNLEKNLNMIFRYMISKNINVMIYDDNILLSEN